MAKETIDIEKVVEWAYRIQCVDRQRPASSPTPAVVSITGGLGEYLKLGTRVDNSGAAARALGIRLPDDATIIHDAVLSLGDVWLEWRARDVVEIWDADRLAERGMVMVRGVDGLAIAPAYEPGLGDASRPVPVQVVSTAVLVLLNGRTGSRPEWHPDWRPSTRVTDGAPDRREVMHARAVYSVWRSALCHLRTLLAGQLDAFEVTGPDAAVMPWKETRRVIVDDIAAEREMTSKRRPPRRKRA